MKDYLCACNCLRCVRDGGKVERRFDVINAENLSVAVNDEGDRCEVEETHRRLALQKINNEIYARRDAATRICGSSLSRRF